MERGDADRQRGEAGASAAATPGAGMGMTRCREKSLYLHINTLKYMALDKKAFSDFYNKDDLPEWLCPVCSKGRLRLATPTSIRIEETQSSIKGRSDDAWDPFWYDGKFVLRLSCSNKLCKESTYCIGDVIHDIEHDENGHQYFEEFLQPKFFNPALKLFEINKLVPKEITEVLLDAFRLFWSDKESCANKIRLVLELVLDDKNVKIFPSSKSRKHRLSLHNRILEFGKKQPDLSARMLAIKWIGNEGSHSGASLVSSDLIDGMDLLENCLYKLYSGEEERLIRLTKQINKRKGALAKSKKRYTTKGIVTM
ncbi:MAG TPA: DUF4145 domain-containing protein [Chitinophagales bacterium]|nr:DUF4145 domain-containing protein [Chitinophagales bacterium]